MFVVIFCTLFTAIVGGINPNIHLLRTDRSAYFRGWLKRIAICLIPAWLQFYFFMPAMVGPFLGMGKVLFQFWAINFISTWGRNFNEIKQKNRRSVWESFPTGSWIAVVFGVVLLCVDLYSSTVFHSNYFASMVGEVKQISSKELVDLSPQSFRAVSPEYATVIGRRNLPDAVSSSFHMGSWYLQRVNGKQIWVSPLEYNKGRNYFSSDGSPGYVVVSAEDPRTNGEFVHEVDGKAVTLRALPSAWSFDNLNRILYLGGGVGYRIAEGRFELDEARHPYWVVPLLAPTLAWSCDRIEKVALVDACTGEITVYSLSEVPSWVDQVIPTQLAVDYINWWGSYQRGYVKNLLKEAGLKELHSGLSLWWDSKGVPYLSGVMVGLSATSNSMVGLIRLNARTGEAEYSPQTGNVVDAFSSAAYSTFSNMIGWHTSFPDIYRMDDEIFWMSPVDGSGGVFQRIVVCPFNGTDAHVVSTLEEGIAVLKSQFSTKKQSSETKEDELTVARIQIYERNGESVCEFTATETPGVIYHGVSQSFPGLVLTNKGDRVKIRVASSPGSIRQLLEFVNPQVLTPPR